MMRPRRVFFFNRFFWPDQSATAQILTDLCRELDVLGYEVTVISSRLDYANKEIQYDRREQLGGVEIVRLWSTRFGRGTLSGRLMDYLTIYYSFFAYILRNLGGGDIVVLKTDPPLLSILGSIGRLVKQFRLVAWCQDVFPEVAIASMRPSNFTSWLFKFLKLVRDWSLRRSDRVVVLGKDMQAYLSAREIERHRLVCISNWAVQEDEGGTREKELRAAWEIPEDVLLVGYSGNLGRAHDWKTLLESAKALEKEDKIHFLLCGGGHGYAALQEAVEDAGLESSFTFLPYQPLDELASALRVPDVHWFTLKEAMTPYIFPSKFFGILQAGRPVIFIGDTRCEIAELLAFAEAGCSIHEGDYSSLVEALRRYSRNPDLLGKEGSNARRLWAENYQRSNEVARWDRMLQELDNIQGG
ncbi:MAG: glycosyltransferase family 4 protein [Puniceicoccaceae bacterium]